MSGNGKTPTPFHAPAGTQLVGQPLTVLSVGVPLNMTLTCNCGSAVDRPVLVIALSVAVACPRCGRMYNALFNPQNGQIAMQVGPPAAEQVPS